MCYAVRVVKFFWKKPMFLNQGTRQPEASQQEVNGDMASESEELVELDDVQLATIVGGLLPAVQAAREAARR